MNRADKAKMLDELGGIDEADYDALVAELIAEIEKQVPELDAAIKAADYERVACIAHSLKGAAGNLRIYAVQEIAKSLELEAKETRDASTLARFYNELVRALAELKTG